MSLRGFDAGERVVAVRFGPNRTHISVLGGAGAVIAPRGGRRERWFSRSCGAMAAIAPQSGGREVSAGEGGGAAVGIAPRGATRPVPSCAGPWRCRGVSATRGARVETHFPFVTLLLASVAVSGRFVVWSRGSIFSARCR